MLKLCCSGIPFRQFIVSADATIFRSYSTPLVRGSARRQGAGFLVEGSGNGGCCWYGKKVDHE